MESTKVQIKPLSCATDWPIWKRRIRDYMDYHEGALDVIDGKLLKPELPESPSEAQRKEYKQTADLYRKANSYAKSVIANAVTEDTYQKIMAKETAREVWDELKRNFEATSKDQLFQICSNFFSFDWLASVDVSGQIAKLKMLWNELNVGLQAAGKNQLPEMLLVCKVMHILPSSFQTFKSSWLMLSEDKQSIDDLVTQLCAFEREMKTDMTSKLAQQDALVAATARQKYSSDKSKDFKNKKKTIGNCNYCHVAGHWVKQCRKWIADGRPAKDATTVSTKQNRDGTSVACISTCGEAFVTQTDNRWFIDNGATKHITNSPENFVTFEKFTVPHRVQAAGKEVLAAVGKGTVKVLSTVDNKQQCVTLLDVWYVPSISRNLFSVLAAEDKHPQNSKFESTATKCCLSIQGRAVIQGTRQVNGTLYESNLITLSPESPAEVNVVSEHSLLQLYHERFGHQDKRHVKAVLKNELDISVQSDEVPICESCIYGKSHRLKFGRRNPVTEVGELFSADVCGPFSGESFSRKQYYVVFKDHYSKMRFIAFLRHKSEVKKALTDVLSLVETQGHKIKEFLSDNGGEFDNEEVREILRSHGITQRLTAPYTPQQNGGSERENRTIVEMARTLKYSNPEAEFPVAMWAELCSTAVYILNRTGKSSVDGMSPSEVWTGKKPRISHLRVVGSVCFAHIPDQQRRKMDKKAIKGYLVGFDSDERYRIWVKEQRKIICSRDVVFQEKMRECGKSVGLQAPTDYTIASPGEPSLEAADRTGSDSEGEITENEVSNNERAEASNYHQLRVRSSLQKPKKFNDFIMSAEIAEAYVMDLYEPDTYEDAIQSRESTKWKEAMDSEMNSLNENHTWELCDLPAEARVIPCKWVYKIKTLSDGSVDKYKARLVAKGFSQRQGVDYNQTFSPVVRLTTIRSVLSIAASERLHLVQFDVSTAFLYGELDEVVYVKQPDGYNDNTNRVCRLLKSLYGLKQAPRCWSRCFGKFLVNLGFKASDADPCLHVRNQNGKILLIALYVDDGLVAASDTDDLNQFIEQLKHQFKVTVRPATYFLGLQIEQQSNGNIKIGQSGYAKKILQRFGFDECKPVQTPMLKGIDKTQINEPDSSYPYRQVVGALMYLMIGTRPDIAFSISYLSRSLEKPTSDDIIKVKRVLRYIAGTLNKNITYKANCDKGILKCYSDSDFGGCITTGRSTSGVVMMYAGGIISWLSQRQPTVATSTTEAEITAASDAVKEVIWLMRLFGSLNVTLHVPVLQVDNCAAVKLAQNPEFHRRTKHIDLKKLFIREKVCDGTINIAQISTSDQVADIMTKPLDKARLRYLCDCMGLMD